MSLEEILVRQAIEGKEDAFAQLYDRHFDKVYRYIYFKVGNRLEAEDLTHEVFFKALEAIGSYKWRQLPFSSWLFRIAQNEVIDYFRRQKKETTLEEKILPTEDDPMAIAEQSLEREQLMAAVDKLSPAQREVIYLRFIAELSIAEVAQILGKSEGTIKALQYNGIVALKKILTGKKNE